ncbi:MAG: replication initiator protein [Microviridae sp.]|nr:MAG: replication initiator protein [Microviridae sp.]
MNCRNPFYLNRGSGKVSYERLRNLSPELRLLHTPLPCGRCIACRVFKAQCWTTRILLESTHYENNTFTTLTYDDEHLPENGHLKKEDLTLWLKRLRKEVPQKLRFFAVGEYGGESLRPHFHVMLFNLAFTEEEVISDTWGKGNIKNGEVNSRSARYVTEYCVKKWTKNSFDRPSDLPPEFMRSSRQHPGGIGTVALEELSANLRRIYGVRNGEPYTGPPIHMVQFQNKWYFLDRYLKTKLNELMYLDPEVSRQKLYEHQTKIFEKHLTVDNYFDKKNLKFKNRKQSDRSERKKRKLKPRREL